jgi:hypothetical protein
MSEIKMERAKKVYATLCEALDDRNWKYENVDDELLVHFTVNGDDLPMQFIIFVDVDRQLLRLLSPFIDGTTAKSDERKITPTDLFEAGLSGGENSAERRMALCELCELPQDLTAKALLEMLNLFYTFDEYKNLIEKIK